MTSRPPLAGSSSNLVDGHEKSIHRLAGTSTQPLKGSMGSISNLHQKKISSGFDTQSVMSSKSNLYTAKNNRGISSSLTNLNRGGAYGSYSGLNFNDTESMYSFASMKRKSKDGPIFLKEKEPTITGLIKPRFYKKEESEIFFMKFSLDDEYLCVALGNGNIEVYSTKTNSIAIVLEFPQTQADDPTRFPCTSMSFRPNRRDFKNQNVLVAAYADGKLVHWHFTSGNRLSVIEDKDGEYNCVEYSPDGTLFAAGGARNCINVFDSFTHKIKNEKSTCGHSNKIFSLKFHPKKSNFLISAGWDKTIQFWDIKSQKSTLSIFEPSIFGDALDFNATGDFILTGSHRKEDALQIYSWPEGKLVETIPWTILDTTTDKAVQLYSAHYSHLASNLPKPNYTASNTSLGEATGSQDVLTSAAETGNTYIIAGGGGPNINEVRIFSNGPNGNKRCVGLISGAPACFYTTAVSHNERLLACGGLGKTLYCYDIDPNLYQEFPY